MALPVVLTGIVRLRGRTEKRTLSGSRIEANLTRVVKIDPGDTDSVEVPAVGIGIVDAEGAFFLHSRARNGSGGPRGRFYSALEQDIARIVAITGRLRGVGRRVISCREKAIDFRKSHSRGYVVPSSGSAVACSR